MAQLELDDHSPSPPAQKTVDLGSRLAFLELSAAAASRLKSMGSVLDKHVSDFVKRFYEFLLAFKETARFLEDPKQVARLADLQRSHFASLFEADWGPAYYSQRRRVGQAHADVGLEPHLFLGAYYQYIQHCLRTLAQDDGKAAANYMERVLPLIKVVFLDISLSLEAYFDKTTDELRRALDLYWKANNDLRRFAQLASHDLKTPIATVANLCEEAVDEFGDQMPEEAKRLVTSARDQAYKNSAIIDDLLQSSLSMQGEDKRDLVSIEEVIREVIDRLRPVIAAKSIEIAVHETLPTVWGNKARLREAFYNLLSNAAKFIDKTPGHIDIKVEELGPRCIVSIEDNGSGIPEGELQRIFVPFRRLAEHQDKPGTGLGLYFTMHLIERDGGQVWAESKQGEGSRFCVALQRPRQDGQEDEIE